jgi:polar amino acid transport system substrate-binding protein
MHIRKLALLALLAGWAVGVGAAEVSMAFGERIPPFCFPETNSGIEVEVMRDALAYRGYVLKPKYFPFMRVPVAFKAHEVDAAMSDLGTDLQADGAFYGDPAVFYDNVFISLASRKLVIRQPEDLRGLTIVAFVGAAKRYPEWLGVPKAERRYFELNDQALQVLTLHKGRYDLVLSDRNIFKYFSDQVQRTDGTILDPVTEHSFVKLNPMDYRPVFRDAKVRDDFNAGLAAIKKSGHFKAIYQKYLGDSAPK